MPRLLIVTAHPDPHSFTRALTERMAVAGRSAGAEVDLCDLYREDFDPRLTISEAKGLPTDDPAVQAHIARLVAADGLIIVHPNWWGGPPALMKGWIDRVFAPGAAYDFEKKIDEGGTPIPLLKTRAALVVNTSNTAADREQAVFGDPLERMWRDCLLSYCGVRQIDRWVLRIIATSTPGQRALWLDEAETRVRGLIQSL
ncbi:MAG: NAD(P)H-dependent oxidoreductase [Elstera sp.]